MEARWLNSILQISEQDWARVFGTSLIKSYAFFLSMENAGLQGASFLYLTVVNAGKTTGIVPCFTYRLMLDVLAPSWFKYFTRKARLIFPKFLQVKIFGVGSLASTCQQHIGIVRNLSRDEYVETGHFISSQIKLKSRELRHKIVFIKEVPDGELSDIRQLLSKDFCFYDSLPNCFIPVFKDGVPYPGKLREKQRYRYRKLKYRFEQRFTWELITDFTFVVDVFERLYLETLSKSGNKFEVLNRHFFLEINERFGNKSFLLVVKNKVTNRSEAIGLLLEDGDSLITLYIGMDYLNDAGTIKLLHSNSMIRAIEVAEIRGKFQVVLGQTSYYPKVLSGALVERLYLGFYSYNRFIQLLIKTFVGKMFAQTAVMHNVYAKQNEENIKAVYNARGINIYN